MLQSGNTYGTGEKARGLPPRSRRRWRTRSGSNLKTVLLNVLKIGLPVAIIAYLLFQAHGNGVLAQLWTGNKNWSLLALACAACFAVAIITFVRWYYLVRALGIAISFRESLRIGFLGYLFNLVPMGGIVAGDLLKVIMLDHRHPGRRTDSLATVFADRIIGLWILFVVASVAIVATGIEDHATDKVRWACRVTLWLTAGGTMAVILPLLPDFSRGRIAALTHQLPWIGPPTAKFAGALRMYRLHKITLAGAALVTVAVHSLLAVSIYLIASGLYGERVQSLAANFVIGPISNATSVIPLGAGPLEGMLDILYAEVPLPDGSSMKRSQGSIVGLCYRMITVLIATIGLAYYLGSRQEVVEMMHEVEQLSEGEEQRSASKDPGCCIGGSVELRG